MFTREDWTLFRNIDTLGQKAGVPKQQLASLVIKELVDNALDTCGSCHVGREGNSVIIQDNGTGIAQDKLPELFSINRPLTSSKLFRMPTRGALGNGLRVVAGAVISTNGILKVSSSGKAFRLIPLDDGHTLAEPIGNYDSPGTRIEITLGAAAGQTNLSWAERAILLADGEPYRGKTSAYWYTTTAFHELCLAANDMSVRELVSMFDGCTGSKASKITNNFKGRLSSSLSRDEAYNILQAMRDNSVEVNPERLGAVGIKDGLPEYYAKSTGKFTLTDARGGHDTSIPFVVEVWARVAEEPAILAHVNRTAVTGKIRAYYSKNELTIYGCGFNHEIHVGKRPVEIWLNIITPYMPITTDGKEPDFSILNINSIAQTIQKAIGKAKRQCPVTTSAVRTQKEIIVEALHVAIGKTGGNGQYRFSQRQLFYAVRPYVIAELGKEPGYNYFCGVLTEYENINGDIAGLYRDERGTLYHPHRGEVIPVGTLSVEEYKRPAWTFSKILYSEKEGLFPILKAAKWPERHDCALLTSKGFASRAARDLLDMMGDNGEPITMFCIHDADAAGTMIYQSLQEATATRPGRSIKIVNLGLEPDEALMMGLEVETINRSGVQKVASYVSVREKRWLQNNRVELNAMPTPIFLQWLDDKMAQYGNGKLVPPQRVLIDTFHDRTQQEVKRRIIDEVLKAADINRMTSRRMSDISVALEQQAAALMGTVVNVLDQEPASSWRDVVEMLACGVVSG